MSELPRLHFNLNSPATPHLPPSPEMKIKVEEENAMDTSGAFDNGAEREGSMVKVEENDAMDTSDTFNHSPEMAVNHEQHNLQPSKRNAAPPPARIDPPVHQNRAAVPVLAQRNCDLWQLPMTPRAFKWARKHARYSESFYHKTCTMLEDKWGCSIAELLPGKYTEGQKGVLSCLRHLLTFYPWIQPTSAATRHTQWHSCVT